MNRMEEIMNSTRLNEFLHRKEQEDNKKNNILWVLAIIGAVATLPESRMRFTVSSHQIIWKILKMILMMTSKMISLKMKPKQINTKCRERVSRQRHAFF